MKRKVKIPLDRPVRFVAVRWSENWEFDHPSLLLEPVVRYSPNGTSLDGMIEDACIDICIDYDKDVGRGPIELTHEDTSREFEFRSWKLETVRRNARKALRVGTHGRKNYSALETYVKFFADKNNELSFGETPSPFEGKK